MTPIILKSAQVTDIHECIRVDIHGKLKLSYSACIKQASAGLKGGAFDMQQKACQVCPLAMAAMKRWGSPAIIETVKRCRKCNKPMPHKRIKGDLCVSCRDNTVMPIFCGAQRTPGCSTYRARISVSGIDVHLGVFQNRKDAMQAYRVARKILDQSPGMLPGDVKLAVKGVMSNKRKVAV